MYWLLEGDKDEFMMTKPRGVEGNFLLSFLRRVHVVMFGHVKQFFAA